MSWALVWLIAGVGLLAAEMLSGEFVLVMLGAGALAAAGVEAGVDNLYISTGVFAVVSLGLLFIARPALKRRFLQGSGVKTNVEALVGSPALALSTVDVHDGRVKLAGQEWSARAYIEGQTIEPGDTVTVVEISGATAIVASEP